MNQPYICARKRSVKGNGSVPFFYLEKHYQLMINTDEQGKIESFINDIIGKWPEVFLIEVKIAAGNSISVLLDSDEGITIEKCTQVNRPLYKFIEENGLFPDNNFSLEVSSAGIDRPLTDLRQYRKNIGRPVEVLMNDNSKTEGVLKDVSETGVSLEETTGKGKKATTKINNILFDQIKHTKVQVTF